MINDPAIKTVVFMSAARSDKRRYPYVNCLVAPFSEYCSNPQAIPNDRLSPRSCNASEVMAKLLVIKPPISSKIVKPRFKKNANLMFLMRLDAL